MIGVEYRSGETLIGRSTSGAPAGVELLLPGTGAAPVVSGCAHFKLLGIVVVVVEDEVVVTPRQPGSLGSTTSSTPANPKSFWASLSVAVHSNVLPSSGAL